MLARCFTRLVHLQPSYRAAEKSLLASLRKKTGYTFANCKKALDLHQNNLVEAEKWLNKQAQQLGWTKATKLEGRKTTQGLVAVAVEQGHAAMVEVNCETDFVARNQHFQAMIETSAKTCLNFSKHQPCAKGDLTKIALDTEQLKQLKAPDGKSLGDHLALMIGTVGENATLRRAICFKGNDKICISGYTHPSGTEKNHVLLGRFGGLVALKQSKPNTTDIEETGKNLCQHIVGMKPCKIGDTMEDKPAKNVDDEKCLIYQEYLLDASVSVQEVLEDSGVDVVDFKRFECGEDLNITFEQPLEQVETCQ